MESTCMFYSWICCRAKWNGSCSAMYIACENPAPTKHRLCIVACENMRFSSLFAAGDVPRGGTSATQRQKFHTDDANQYLYNKSSSHGVPNINLSNFTCLLVDFGKVLCSSAKELQQNSNAFIFGLKQCYYNVDQSALLTGFRTDFTSSVWNFCR